MNTLKNLISCPLCNQRLSDPIFLPCGQTICKWHITVANGSLFECSICSQSHLIPEHGFPKNVPIANALSECIDRQVFGDMYTKARENVSKLEETLRDCKKVCDDKKLFVHNFFSDIKNRIDLNEEQFRLFFNEANSNTRALVEKYEQECYQNLETEKFENFDDAQNHFNETNDYLNAMHLDHGHWHWIRNSTREKQIQAIERLEKLKDSILLNKHIEFVLTTLDFRDMLYRIIELVIFGKNFFFLN